MGYTIKETADFAGVTTRTIRYYDEIGLLIPSKKLDNGYRYYNQESILRLQQILFFRELDVPLKEIQKILGQSDFNFLDALKNHQTALKRRVARLNKLVNTVDETIATIKGEWIMTAKEYFEGFDEFKYQAEA
ncbi:MAG: MerR family transcriptional regulator, partial [Chloroflexota bacterium]